MRAIARRRNGLVTELPGHFGNAASVRARRRAADGSLTTGPRAYRSPPGTHSTSPTSLFALRARMNRRSERRLR
ncbi:hypothetical protein DBP20_25300 [Streptomyces sp. CS131]|nr:hypothetical protein DBP20_25300 [Streptomyces sp. CS131]